MATGKSSSNKWLTLHVVAYMIPFAVATFLMFSSLTDINAWKFLALNFVFHWITDYATSRVGAAFYKRGMRGEFFETIGFDRLIHQLCLFGTYYAFFV